MSEVLKQVVVPIFDEAGQSREDIAVNFVEMNGEVLLSRESLLGALGIVGYYAELETNKDDISFPSGLVVRTGQRRVTFGSRALPYQLTSREYSIIHAMALEPYRAHSRGELLEHGWGEDAAAYDPHVIDVHLSNVRNKFGARNTPPVGPNQGLIETVRGFGFRFGERLFSAEQLVVPKPTDVITR